MPEPLVTVTSDCRYGTSAVVFDGVGADQNANEYAERMVLDYLIGRGYGEQTLEDELVAAAEDGLIPFMADHHDYYVTIEPCEANPSSPNVDPAWLKRWRELDQAAIARPD